MLHEIDFQTHGFDMAWCDSCHNIVGSTVFNDDEIYDIEHKICPNCVRAIIKKYDKARKTGEQLKEIPDEVNENIYNIFRVNIESNEGWMVCDYCGRLWKQQIRITLPVGKCKRCLKTPNILNIREWYEKL